MLIHEMTRQASIDLLARTRLCRLACAHEGQPYIALIHCAYDDDYIYSFSAFGQKITWMRANPLVCVEADELANPQDWATVIVLGRYEELPDTPQYKRFRQHAYDLLQRQPLWWEPGFVKTALHEKAPTMEFMYFRIRIDQINGRRGIPDTVSDREVSKTGVGPAGRLRRILGRSAHKKGDR
jgi:nitroimidazol reductase NimA-like FMN-containing flavoprotein (pyridoxamine 5'-phosphate oxidase superfamily)